MGGEWRLEVEEVKEDDIFLKFGQTHIVVHREVILPKIPCLPLCKADSRSCVFNASD